ncbi:hypothetical protein M885DRAFT_504968 [Pelagophyceae sp. CCMP2097]|nr:hypothetical protein M885DRAFT_504968 [Pelagophyceae sp. CCMP2097]
MRELLAERFVAERRACVDCLRQVAAGGGDDALQKAKHHIVRAAAALGSLPELDGEDHAPVVETARAMLVALEAASLSPTAEEKSALAALRRVSAEYRTDVDDCDYAFADFIEFYADEAEQHWRARSPAALARLIYTPKELKALRQAALDGADRLAAVEEALWMITPVAKKAAKPAKAKQAKLAAGVAQSPDAAASLPYSPAPRAAAEPIDAAAAGEAPARADGGPAEAAPLVGGLQYAAVQYAAEKLQALLHGTLDGAPDSALDSTPRDFGAPAADETPSRAAAGEAPAEDGPPTVQGEPSTPEPHRAEATGPTTEAVDAALPQSVADFLSGPWS